MKINGFCLNKLWHAGIKNVFVCSAIITFLLLLSSIGFSATFISGLSYPTGIAIHPNERSLYVNSGNSGTVWKIPIKSDSTAGTINVVTDQFDPPGAIVFDAAGNLYGVENEDPYQYIYIVSTTGSTCAARVDSYDPFYPGIAIEAPGLSNNRMFFGSSGYYPYIMSALLSAVDCPTSIFDEISPEDIGSTCGEFRHLLYRPSRGDIVGSQGDKVVTVNLTNGSCSTLVSSLINPNGLAEDSKGNLFIADTGAGKIFKRDILGVTSEIARGLKGPTGLFFDSETGLLFISETNAGRITTIPVDSALTGRIILKIKDASNQWSGALVAPTLKSPNSPAACVDDSNILYVFATKEDEQLYMSKRTPAGAWSTWVKVPGNLKTVSTPTAVHNNGKILLYVRGLDDKVWESIYTISTKKWGAWRAVTGIKTPESPEVTADKSGNVYFLTRGVR